MFGACYVIRGRAAVVAAGEALLIEGDELAARDAALLEPDSLLVGAVDPDDLVGLAQLGGLVDPGFQFIVIDLNHGVF